MEVVHSPYSSDVPIFSAAVSALRTPGKSAIKAVVTALGAAVKYPLESGYLQSAAQSGARFYEVHVYPVPLDLLTKVFPAVDLLPCSWKGWDSLVINWLSEVDFVNWRIAADLLSLKKFAATAAATYSAGLVCPLNACVGHWGALYPRRGFVYTRNDFVGGALAAWRAYHWACKSPYAVRISRLKGCTTDKDRVRMQLAYPSSLKCIKPGGNLLTMEAGHVSSSYVWIVWRKRKCCVGSLKAAAKLLAAAYVPEAVMALNAVSTVREIASLAASVDNAVALLTSKLPDMIKAAREAVATEASR